MREVVSALDFRPAGRIHLLQAQGPVKFNLLAEYVGRGQHADGHGWVYLWVKVNGSALFDVCYVGKAGKTLKARCAQHVGGFNGGSGKGIENSSRLREFLSASQDHQMHVLARKSPEAAILDEQGVSMCEVEERAMIKKLRRLGAALWNSA
jgi:hypothetical protein